MRTTTVTDFEPLPSATLDLIRGAFDIAAGGTFAQRTSVFEPKDSRKRLNRPSGARNPWASTNPKPEEHEMTRYFITLVLAIAAALLSTYAKAEKVVVYREGQLVNPHDVAAVLGKTRSIRLLDDSAAAPAKLTMAAVSPAKSSATSPARARRMAPDDWKADASALSLPVRFAFGSANILPNARTQLDALAEGIKLLAPERIVTVEGHTDAVGSNAYNLELSRVRAHAVRDYLVQRHGIDAARLKTAAYGESRPIEGSNPKDAVNRRVQFRGS
jgi:outer membrane protein OmpA-like peptidoglycan-associated protein